MNAEQIELEIIGCIHNNVEESGGVPETLSADTEMSGDATGLDSHRVLEVLVELSSVLDCELPPEKIFTKNPTGIESIRDVAHAIYKLTN